MKPCPSCRRHVVLDAPRCPFCGEAIADTTAHRVAFAFGLVAAVVGCGPQRLDDGDDAHGSSTGGLGTTGSSVSVSSSTTSVDATGTSSTGDPTIGDSTEVSGTESSGGFIDDPDGGSVYGSSCNVWKNDCIAGDKCTPWSNDGTNAWNDTRCSPVARDAAPVGASCVVEFGPTGGVDDCDVGSMCFHVDPTTNEGVCVAFCTGTRATPTCADPLQVCSITHEGALVLCLTPCDPLAPACPDGHSCQAGADAFVCVRAGEGAIGDPCRHFLDCELGSSCIDGATPGCEDACCTTPCDPAAPVCGSPEQTCTALGDAGVCSVG
jgi:hypothetical protein